ILTSRMIDRPVRPLFAEGFKCETQVIAFVLSADTENDPDVAAINAASAALTISDIPFLGPIGAVRVGYVDGKFVTNPTYSEMRDSLVNIVVVGSLDGIVMIESGAKEVPEETVVEAIEHGHNEIKKELEAALPEDDEDAKKKLKHYYEVLRERIFREQVIDQKRRPDARAFDQIRDIWIEVGVLPRTHGSAIFTRGETQALVTTTLGTSDDMQRIEAFEGEAKKRFLLHYNFPPFSVGEVAFLRGAGRREIGHGALAERSIS